MDRCDVLDPTGVLWPTEKIEPEISRVFPCSLFPSLLLLLACVYVCMCVCVFVCVSVRMRACMRTLPLWLSCHRAFFVLCHGRRADCGGRRVRSGDVVSIERSVCDVVCVLKCTVSLVSRDPRFRCRYPLAEINTPLESS